MLIAYILLAIHDLLLFQTASCWWAIRLSLTKAGNVHPGFLIYLVDISEINSKEVYSKTNIQYIFFKKKEYVTMFLLQISLMIPCSKDFDDIQV